MNRYLGHQNVFRKFSGYNFGLSDAEDNTSVPLNRVGISDFSVTNSPKIPGANFLGREVLFCFISIWTFCSFKNSFATITSLSELYFSVRPFILLVQMKK